LTAGLTADGSADLQLGLLYAAELVHLHEVPHPNLGMRCIRAELLLMWTPGCAAVRCTLHMLLMKLVVLCATWP
jgi:hypothetical protein